MPLPDESAADPGHGAEQGDVAMVGAEPAQLALAFADLAVELVDQAQAGIDRLRLRLDAHRKRAR